jgi:hypothetical protein
MPQLSLSGCSSRATSGGSPCSEAGVEVGPGRDLAQFRSLPHHRSTDDRMAAADAVNGNLGRNQARIIAEELYAKVRANAIACCVRTVAQVRNVS